MAPTPMSDNASNKSTETISTPEMARIGEMNESMLNETAKFNAQLSSTFQNLGREWTEFVGTRLREDIQFFRTIHECHSMQDLQQAYSQFWQTAFTQYGDEAKRLLGITQGAVEDAARSGQNVRETVVRSQEKILDKAHDRAA